MKYLYTFLVVSLVLLIGCDKDEFTLPETGSEYFPLKVGLYWIYAVNETAYSEVAEPQQSTYQLKVEVVDSVLNGAGTYTYIVYRSTRYSHTAPWTALDTWSIRKSDQDVIVNEGNTPYRKLLFPVRAGLSWNGNQYNSLGEDEYTMFVSGPVEISGLVFTEPLLVEQEKNEDFIVYLDERSEVYAKDVGLVTQSVKQLSYCTAENCIGQQKIKSGKVYLQQLSSYGEN